MKLTTGSLFAGIGGFEYAGSQINIDCPWSSEIDPTCNAILKYRWPQTEQLGDISKIDGAKIQPVDIITFGSPCQDMSVAGRRAGLDGERSVLFRDAIRIVYEMREMTNGKQPKYIVWENVPGAFSSNKGFDFRAVLEEITKAEIPMPATGRWATAGMVRGGGG